MTVSPRLDATAREILRAVPPGVIFCIWHNRLALAPLLYHRYISPLDPHRRMAGMVSASRDGALLARVLELFRIQPVRGSTSRRGPQALRELTSWGEQGYDLAITPDGPRGPRYVIQEGVMMLAQLTGIPILPVCYRVRPKICVGSWDQFQVPLPFARCEVRAAPLLPVPREATDAEREELRQALQTIMRELTED